MRSTRELIPADCIVLLRIHKIEYIYERWPFSTCIFLIFLCLRFASRTLYAAFRICFTSAIHRFIRVRITVDLFIIHCFVFCIFVLVIGILVQEEYGPILVPHVGLVWQH